MTNTIRRAALSAIAGASALAIPAAIAIASSSSLSDWGFVAGDFGEVNVLRRGIGSKRG
jgi:hypothetical protein